MKTVKKNVLVSAIATAVMMGAGASCASPVKVYGNLDASVSHVDTQSGVITKVKDKVASGDFVNSNRSYFGVKGIQSMGSTDAFFKLEFENDIDDMSSTINARNAFVGLKSAGVGTVLLGRGDTVFKSVEPLDTFDRHYMDAEFASMGLGAESKAGQEQFDNMATYVSPNLGKLRFGVTLSSNEGNGLDGSNTATSGSLNDKVAIAVTYGSKYNPGIYLAAGYEGYSPDTINGMYGGGVHESAGAWRIGGQYKLHHLTVGGMYQSFDRSGGDAASEGVWVDGDNVQINIAYSLNKVTLKGKYSQTDYDASGYKTANAYGVGLDYSLSRQTSLYAEYALSDNATLVQTNGNNYNIGQEKAGTSAFAVGISHHF